MYIYIQYGLCGNTEMIDENHCDIDRRSFKYSLKYMRLPATNFDDVENGVSTKTVN